MFHVKLFSSSSASGPIVIDSVVTPRSERKLKMPLSIRLSTILQCGEFDIHTNGTIPEMFKSASRPGTEIVSTCLTQLGTSMNVGTAKRAGHASGSRDDTTMERTGLSSEYLICCFDRHGLRASALTSCIYQNFLIGQGIAEYHSFRPN